MSTPTTATATLPHYGAYPFGHQSAYRSTLPGSSANRLGHSSGPSPSFAVSNTNTPYSPTAVSSPLSHVSPAASASAASANHASYGRPQPPTHYHSSSNSAVGTQNYSPTHQNHTALHPVHSHDHGYGVAQHQQQHQQLQQQQHLPPQLHGALHDGGHARHPTQHETPTATASFSTVASSTTLPPPRRSHGTTSAGTSTTDAGALHASMGSHTAQTSPGTDQPVRKRRRSGPPDWNTFYRNGLPQEVIVIEDTPERETKAKGKANGKANGASNASAVSNNGASAVYLYDHSAITSSDQHIAKKRRRQDQEVLPPASTLIASAGGSTRYDPVHNYVQHSSGSTISSERTNSHSLGSLYTATTVNTAATSLASNDGHYEYDTSTQKRKRTTRQNVSNEARKRDALGLGNAYTTYQPPQLPPIKAGEVNVKVVRDALHKNVRVDDDDGHYIVSADADLTKRYQIVKLLGQGTFGKVVQARDRERGELVAIKIIRSVQKYRDASRIELRVLETLKANDRENRNRCIHLRECFDFRNHICIVMDLLGQSVFDFLKGNSFVPFPNSQIQSFARQLFTSVAFLHDLQLIHTDLKPENILLVDSAYQTFTYNRKIPSSSTQGNRQANQRRVLLDTEIRLIDFGSATFQEEYHSSVVSTRHYRAPEIILGLGWSFPCDIWSIGCILVEFYTGDALFQTHDNLEHLAMMEAVCDARIDTHLVQQVMRSTGRHGGSSNGTNPAAKWFKRMKLDYPAADTSRASRRFVKAMKRLEDIFPSNTSFMRNFIDLLSQIFVYDPSQRITAKQALQHPWFREAAVQDDGTEAARIRLKRDLKSSSSSPPPPS